MLAHLADVSIRSLVLAALAGIVVWVLQSRRTAALEHAIWTAVVCGMLALFAFGTALPRIPLRILGNPAAVVGQVRPTSAPPLPFEILSAEQAVTSSSGRGTPIHWKDIAPDAYIAITLAFLVRLATGTLLARRLLAKSSSVGNFSESELISVPLTVGWMCPRILLPLEWREWNREKLDAVLAHEGAHASRHDGLVALLAEVNRCIFWFHPLAWILERRLAMLAEKACDESTVAVLGDRERYARLLLEMAEIVDASHGRIRRHALTMAAGSHIRQRIDSILQEGRTFSRGLSWTGGAAVALCAVPLMFCAAALELDRQPPLLKLDARQWSIPAPSLLEQKLPESKRALVAQAQRAPIPTATPQPVPAPAPKFDTVTVKPCGPDDGAGRSGRGGGRGRGIPMSPPGELFVNCLSVWELVNHSIEMGNAPLLNNHRMMPFDADRVRGGPAWVRSDYFTIDAKTTDPAAMATTPASPAWRMLNGPMLEALIEEKFHLKTHRETEVVTMFALTVSDSGFKLQPMEEGGCTPHEPGTPLLVSQMFPPGQRPLCVMHTGWDRTNWTIDAAGQGLGNLAGALGGAIMDRPVLDKTSITGAFTFHLVFAHDETTPGLFPPGFPSPSANLNATAGPPLANVLEQQLGLKLVPDTGPREFVVIDSVERPSEN